MRVESGPANALYSSNIERSQAYVKDGMITEAALAATIEMLKKLEVDVPDNPMRFVDMSLVQKASKL